MSSSLGLVLAIHEALENVTWTMCIVFWKGLDGLPESKIIQKTVWDVLHGSCLCQRLGEGAEG